MLKIKSITFLLIILFTSSVFAAFPPGDTTQVNLYTRADMCINCDQNATDAFVLSLVPSYSLNNSEYFIYVVDPVLSSKVVYEVEAFHFSKVITHRRDMTTSEGAKFEPLMVYAKNVVALKQIITQKNPDGLLNTDTCDSSLDAHSNRGCAAALIKDLRLEAEVRNLFNIPNFTYSVTVGGSAKVINGSITVLGQGSDGILRVVYTFADDSIAVYKVTAEGEVIKIELDLESSLTAGQEVLKLIIDALARDKFSAFGIEGHELDDFAQMWAGGQGHFCNLVPTYKMVQAEQLQCASYPTIACFEIRCRLTTSTAAPQAAYTCS